MHGLSVRRPTDVLVLPTNTTSNGSSQADIFIALMNGKHFVAISNPARVLPLLFSPALISYVCGIVSVNSGRCTLKFGDNKQCDITIYVILIFW